MKVKIKCIDNEQTVLVWLSSSDQTNDRVLKSVEEYRNTYKNVVLFLSGNKPAAEVIKIIVKHQENKWKGK